MTEIYRVRSAWTGFIGAPGVTTMYFLDVATACASVHQFWADVHTYLPADVHVKVENFGDIIEDTTGTITGAWSADAETESVGVSTDAYSAPSGACVNWITDTIVTGRRLRGRTFLVPLGGNKYQNDGTLDNDSRGAIVTAAEALIAAQSTSFVIWHRGTGSDGSNGLVTSTTVRDVAAVLRSRRD